MPSSSVTEHEIPREAEAEDAPAIAVDPDKKAGIKILVVDDDHTLRESCATVLELEGFDVTVRGRGDEALELLRRRPFDIALLDLYMSQTSGLELLKTGLEANRDLVAVIMTGNASVESNMEALEAGAWDYLAKPFSATQLQVMIGRATHAVLAAKNNRAAEARLEREHGHSEAVTVLGQSPAFRKVMDTARRVAPTDASVFITGESGTGKELIAQFIHHHSRRNRKPLVPVNCAALPETLLESEMFGHVKGSFTGAVRDKPGLLEIANGGTLFLDEITEMSQALQAKLLRAIQDGVVRRVGSTKTDAIVDVRFIVATNRDPEAAVREGVLREDLYYRLRVVPVRVPPLRERPQDIAVLARHFLGHYWKRHRGASAPVPELTQPAIRALENRAWPGNVRELQNAIEHAVVFLEPGASVQPEDVPSVDGHRAPSGGNGNGLEMTFADEPYHDARERITAEFERRYLEWIVQRAAGNMSKAARIAGIDRTTVYRLMEKHGLERDAILMGMSNVE